MNLNKVYKINTDLTMPCPACTTKIQMYYANLIRGANGRSGYFNILCHQCGDFGAKIRFLIDYWDIEEITYKGFKVRLYETGLQMYHPKKGISTNMPETQTIDFARIDKLAVLL